MQAGRGEITQGHRGKSATYRPKGEASEGTDPAHSSQDFPSSSAVCGVVIGGPSKLTWDPSWKDHRQHQYQGLASTPPLQMRV